MINNLICIKTIIILLLALFSANTLRASDIPESILYPPYFQETDAVNWQNIKQELRYRFRFSLAYVYDYNMCLNAQQRLEENIDSIRESKVDVPELNNENVFGDDSVFTTKGGARFKRFSPKCSYAYFGNIEKGDGFVYCKYHGMLNDIKSSFAEKHMDEFKGKRPWFNAADAAEFLIFFPGLLVFIVSSFILYKII